MKVKEFYKELVNIGFDEKGIVNKVELKCADNFNFCYDVIDKYAELEPDRRALVWVNPNGDERIFTYGDLSSYSKKAANLFASKGIKKGDPVMLVLKRNYQFWFSILGLIRLGAIAIPATHLLTVKDFVYRFTQSDAVSIITTGINPEVGENVDEAETEIGVNLKCKFIANGTRDGWINFDDELEKQSDTLERVKTDGKEKMLLYFTSGTTGYPKMVTLNHRYALAHLQTAVWQNVQDDGLHLTVSDTGWAKSAWGKLFGQMLLGAAVFVYDFDKFNAADLLSIISKYKITSFCAPPTMYRFFIKEDMKQYDLSALKYTVIAGEALNPEVFDRWLEYTGLKLMEGFGQTEATLITANFPGMEPKPGSMGKPTPLYKVELVDDSCNPVPAGEVGEIVVRCNLGDDGLFDGYYKNPELTAKVYSNGLYHTGDIAWKDEDGYFWYVGRNDDIIKSSGYRIGPFEIESVLITHPAVLECAVTGAPDPTRGQVVKASVILAKGYAPSDELAKELQKHVIESTAPYKYPRIVEFVNELPKTISGKIKRAQIRQEDNK